MVDLQQRDPVSNSIRDVMIVLGAVGGLWALTLALVSPTGEFPLNDDWIYAGAVQNWMETGDYVSHPFTTANLVGQAWWGKLFCGVFGFSFTALRWSTLTLWLLAGWATGLIALRLQAPPWIAALAGGLIIANPLAMNLGYTFMTDVPFMALMALAGYCYVRGLEAHRWTWLLAGSLFGAGGLLVRQFAILLPLALVLVLAPWSPRWRRREAVAPVVSLLLPWVAAWGLLRIVPSFAAELGHTWDPGVLGNTWPGRIVGGMKFYGIALVYLGLFTFPLVPGALGCWIARRDGGGKRRATGLAFILVAVVLAVCLSAPRRIPFVGNLLYDTGVGPMTMKGIFMGVDLWRPVSVGGWWWLPTLLGLISAGFFVAGTIRWLFLIPGDGRKPVSDPRRRQQVFLMAWAVLMVVALYHPWLPVRFDRYFLGALVPVVLLLAMTPTRPGLGARGVATALLVLLYGFSVVSLQDYMAWNQARWDIANRLMEEKGVTPEEIDAGYEFNGWLTSTSFIERTGPRAFLDSGPLGWWAVKDTWAVSWLPRPHFETVEEVPYGSWLAGDKGKLLLLKRKSE